MGARNDMPYDAVVVGGGPAGLSAALALGRARKRVLLCDAGPRRNATAEHIHNFVTHDGTPPSEFRRLGRQQLQPYGNVEARDTQVKAIGGERGRFAVQVDTETVEARRVLLCTGMIDELPDIEGYRALWGTSIFLCPYCHGWEVQDRRFGAFVASAETLEFALLLRGWSREVVALTDGRFAVPPEARDRFARAGVSIEERRITRLAAGDGQLRAVEFAEGGRLPLDLIFARHPQRQVPLVQSLALALDAAGYVTVDPTHHETSRPGIYAGGDLIAPKQAAIIAAASGYLAAASLNHDLTVAPA